MGSLNIRTSKRNQKQYMANLTRQKSCSCKKNHKHKEVSNISDVEESVVTSRLLRCFTKKLNTYYIIMNDVLRWHVCLLYDKAPSHASQLVKQFLKLQKVTVLPPPPYSPDQAYATFSFTKTYQVLIWSSLQVPRSPHLSHQSNASQFYRNQRTITQFRNEFRD